METTKPRRRGGGGFWAMALLAVLQAGLGGFFLLAGAMKLARVGPDIAIFEGAGLPGWALAAAGLVNVAGGAGMLLGFRWRAVATPASLLIAAYLAFAIYVALLNDDPRDAAQLAVMLALSVVVASVRNRRGRTPAPAWKKGGTGVS